MDQHQPFLEAIARTIAGDARHATRLESLPIKICIGVMLLTLARAMTFPFPLTFAPTLLELRWCDLSRRRGHDHCFDAMDRYDEALGRVIEWRNRVGVGGMVAPDLALLALGFVTAAGVRLAARAQRQAARQSIEAARLVINELNNEPPLPV